MLIVSLFGFAGGNNDEVIKIREQIGAIASKVVAADDETAESTVVAEMGDIGMGNEEEVEELEDGKLMLLGQFHFIYKFSAHFSLLGTDKEWETFRAERFRVLADAKFLKQLASFFLHPEAAVKVDAFATARCYFDRASAPLDVEDLEGE